MGTLPNYIVGVGGSAGSLVAFKELLLSLPSNTGMAFVFVAHIVPDANSYLAEILSRCTNMPTMVASTAVSIQANHVYVSSPNSDLLVENYHFKIVSPRTKRNVLVDYLFTSLADSMGAGAIGIVLSGYHHDGTEGCKQIKMKGGITFAQDSSADVGDMPISAQDAGYIDFVLPPSKIAEALAKIASAANGKLSPDRRRKK